MLILVTGLIGCGKSKKSSITCRILVAASAREATEHAIDGFLQSFNDHQQPEVILVSGPSNGLAQQILAGAPADIFVSANPKWTAAIDDESDLTKEFVSNRLVLATHRLKELQVASLEDLDQPQVKSVAIAVESVPVGDYARQAISHLSADQQSSLNSKLVFGKDSSALVAWLENREADYGFVYASDARASSDLKEVHVVDLRFHDPIIYSIAKLKNANGEGLELRDQLFGWLQSDESMKVFEDAGFTAATRKPPAISNSID